MKKVIATDVDGVLLSWQSGLPYFAQKYNLPLEHILEMIQDDKFIKPGTLFGCDEVLAEQLINKYNCSDFIRYLAPYMDALRQINRLKKTYDFVAVTALGDSIDARLNRQFNLNALFPGAFQDIQMCAHNESKEIILTKVRLKYGNRIKFYVDDLAHHCQAAKHILDVPVYWMVRGERDGHANDCIKVADWDELVSNEEKKAFGSGESLEDILRKNIHQMPWPPKPVPSIWPDMPKSSTTIPVGGWKNSDSILRAYYGSPIVRK